MEKLTNAERELVALGAALGSNCVPCIEHHIPAARKAGLSDRRIDEAIRLADQIRQVPAKKVLAAAFDILQQATVEQKIEPQVEPRVEPKVEPAVVPEPPARAAAEPGKPPCGQSIPGAAAEAGCCV